MELATGANVTRDSAYFTGFSLDPAADFFVSDRASIGGSIHLGYAADRYYLLQGVPVDEKVTSLGIGPRVYLDLTRSAARRSRQNDETLFAIETLVGGWV